MPSILVKIPQGLRNYYLHLHFVILRDPYDSNIRMLKAAQCINNLPAVIEKGYVEV